MYSVNIYNPKNNKILYEEFKFNYTCTFDEIKNNKYKEPNMDDKIKEAYLEHLTDMVNNMDYSEIDCFCEDNELSEEDIEAIQSLPLKVVIDE